MRFKEFISLSFTGFLIFTQFVVLAQLSDLKTYNIIWTTQSQNSSESMPCGGGDIGLNVWVEKGEILFYLSRSNAPL